MISGHLEGDETVKQAMIREAKEETGIKVSLKDLSAVHVMHRKSNNNLEYIDFFLIADKWQSTPQIMEPDKCDDIQWLPLKNLPKNTLLYIKQALRSYKNKISFSEVGFV